MRKPTCFTASVSGDLDAKANSRTMYVKARVASWRFMKLCNVTLRCNLNNLRQPEDILAGPAKRPQSQ